MAILENSKAYSLRKLADQDLIRLIKNLRLEIAASYGKLAPKKQQRTDVTVPLVDPRNNFRRKLIARALTILNERGIKGDY